MAELRLPKLGVGMETGRLTSWLVSDGALIRQGDLVATIETEKSEVEIEAPASGVIRFQAEAGGEFEVGALLAVIEE